MNDHELEECFNFIFKLARDCGEIVKAGSEDIGKVETKGDFYNLVTKYDGQVEDVLINTIKQKYPNHW